MAKSKNLNLTFTPTKSVRKGTQASAYVLNPDNLGEGNKMAGQAQAIIATLVKLAESTGSLTVTRDRYFDASWQGNAVDHFRSF